MPLVQITIVHESLGSYQLSLNDTDSLVTLYSNVRERFSLPDFHLKYRQFRLSDSQTLLSQVLPTSSEENITIQLASQIEDLIQFKYMCELCGHLFFRSPEDPILCPRDGCGHGILLKCRRDNVTCTYDAR